MQRSPQEWVARTPARLGETLPAKTALAHAVPKPGTLAQHPGYVPLISCPEPGLQAPHSGLAPGPAHSGTPGSAPPSPKAAPSPASPASPLGRAPTFAEGGRRARLAPKYHVTRKPANGARPSARRPADCESQCAPRARWVGVEESWVGGGARRRLTWPKDAAGDLLFLRSKKTEGEARRGSWTWMDSGAWA